MTSAPAVRWSGDPFERLPTEILLDIVKATPDLPSLWAISEASAAVALVIDAYGAEVIYPTMHDTMAYQIQAIIQMIMLIRSPSGPCKTLKKFIDLCTHHRENPPVHRSGAYYICGVLQTPLSKAEWSADARHILALYHQISLLTNSCLRHLIGKSMAIQPSHHIDPAFRYSSSEEPREPWRKRPEGQRYQPQNSGPPTWVETIRVSRAFWRVQMFCELKNASSQSQLGWPKKDMKRLKKMDVNEFIGTFASANAEPEQVQTILGYMQEVAGPSSASGLSTARGRHLELPWPAQEAAVAWPAPCHDKGWNEFDFYKAPPLEWEAPGLRIGRMVSTQRSSPIRGVTFEPFRGLGFAIWHFKRLIGLEVSGPPHGNAPPLHFEDDVFFTWQSILSDEVRARVHRKLDEERVRVQRKLKEELAM